MLMVWFFNGARFKAVYMDEQIAIQNKILRIKQFYSTLLCLNKVLPDQDIPLYFLKFLENHKFPTLRPNLCWTYNV